MKHKCPCCGRDAIETITSWCVDDHENIVQWECQFCYAIATLVIWDILEDRVHSGINYVSEWEMGDTVVLKLTRNRDEALTWNGGRRVDSVQLNPN